MSPVRAPAVSDDEVSMVVQGPIYGSAHGQLTKRVLESVRKFLPRSELILSTWAGSETAGLSFDRLVQCDDPGGFPHTHDSRVMCNLSRQIVSTVEGLRVAARPYAGKLRSDMLLTGNEFLRMQKRFPARSADYPHFSERVLCPTIYSTNPARAPALFVVSDWFSFGRREDLLLLWDVPLAPEEEMTRYFAQHPEENRLQTTNLARFGAEQYIWLHSLGKRFTIPFRHGQDFSPEAIRIAEQALADNFILLELNQIGLQAPRHRLSRGDWAICYSHGEWLRLYRKHCAPEAALSFDTGLLGKKLTLRALRLREMLTGKPSGRRHPVQHYLQ